MSIRQACWRSSSGGRCTATSCGRSSSTATGSTWPLNVGQVYTTLARLERDGLVERRGRRSDGADGRQRRYAITDRRGGGAAGWFATPVASRPARATSWRSSSRSP